MDANLVAQVLGGTYDANTQVRTQAEAQLAQLERTPGYLSTLLQIIGAKVCSVVRFPITLCCSMTKHETLRAPQMALCEGTC